MCAAVFVAPLALRCNSVRVLSASRCAVFIKSTIYCLRGTTKRPRFVLQPFCRGVGLHSWTRLRVVPGGGVGCRGTGRQGRSGHSPSQTCCTQADAIMAPVPSICRYICRYISSDSEISLANTGVVDSCAPSATIPFYPGVTSSASSISSPSSLDGGVMSFAIFARSPSQCPMKAASSSGVISARFLS